jgi:hypothetical protein
VKCGNWGIALAVFAARRHCVQEDRRLLIFKGFGNEFLERPSDLDYHSGFSNVRARYGCKGEEPKN